MKRLLLIAGLVLGLPGVSVAREQPAPESETERPDMSGESPAAPETPSSEELATISVRDPALPAESGEATQLDELVVTAQKIKQPLRKVPLSVSAFDGQFIAETGSADLADVSLYVPNVRVDADDLGSPQVFIRGFGTNAFNPSFEASVGFVQDELFFGRPGYFTEAMFDVDRVEVLRGPQGTLFGKNTIAGVFNVTSRGPDSGLAADVRLFGGEDNEQRYEGGVGGMLTDWAGARLAALYRKQDGELYNQFLDRSEEALEQQAARVKLALYPGAGIKTELTAVESQTEAPFWPFQLYKLDDDTRDYLDDFDPNIEDDPTNFITSFDTAGFIDKGSETVGLKTEWELGERGPVQDLIPVLVLGTSKFHIDQLNELDVSPADISRLDNHEDHEQLSGELRVSGRFDSLFGLGTGLEFIAGGFYYDSNYVLLARVLAGQDLASYVQTDDFAQLATQDGNASSTGGGMPIPVGGPITATLADGDFYQFDYVQDVESLAFFGQATWYLSDRWALTPGVRFNREKKRVDTKGESHCQGKELGQPCFMEQLLQSEDYDHRDLRREETDVSPKLALQYFSDHGINYYASYARGFKSGGFNSISFKGDNLEYQPEKARTVELGAKARFFDNRVGINATVYRTDFENLQVLAFNGVFFDVSNAADARSEGLELDFQWLTPYEPLRINGSLGLLDAKYLSYPEAPAPISQGVNQQQDLSGQRIAFAPRQTATLTPTLSYLFGGYIATLAVDALYQGEQYTDTDLDPNTRVDAYTKYSARLIFSRAGGWWTLSAGGTNLTDERVLNQVTDAVFFPGTYYAQQASGRQLFAVLTLQL